MTAGIVILYKTKSVQINPSMSFNAYCSVKTIGCRSYHDMQLFTSLFCNYGQSQSYNMAQFHIDYTTFADSYFLLTVYMKNI